MVLRWLDQHALTAAVSTDEPVTHTAVIEQALRHALALFDHGESQLPAVLDLMAPGVGTILKAGPPADWGMPYGLVVQGAQRQQMLTVLSWLRFIQGQAPGLKRQALAGLLRGYPLQVAARILSPNKRLGLRAVKQMHERALAAILRGVCDAYGLEPHDEFGFKPA